MQENGGPGNVNDSVNNDVPERVNHPLDLAGHKSELGPSCEGNGVEHKAERRDDKALQRSRTLPHRMLSRQTSSQSFMVRQLESLRAPSLSRVALSGAPSDIPDVGLMLPHVDLDVKTEEAKMLCIPGTRWHMLLVVLACSIAFGPSFSRSILSAVSADVMLAFGMTKATYGALSGLPAIPNIFASPIGGAIVDRLGADKSCVLYSGITVLGSICLSTAVYIRSVHLLAAAQILLGIGRGTLVIAQKVFLKLAADPKETSFLFALSFSISHAGMFMAFFLSPLIEDNSPYGYLASVWASTGITVLSFLCTIPLLGKLRHILPLLRAEEQESFLADEEEEEEDGKAGEAEERGGGPTASSRWDRREEGSWVELVGAGTLQRVMNASRRQGRGASMSDLANHPIPSPSCWQTAYQYFEDLISIPFFLLVLCIVCYYMAFVPLETFAVDYLKSDLGYKASTASLGASLVMLGSVFLGPFFGLRVDIELWKKGVPGQWTRRLCPPGATQAWAMFLTGTGILTVTLAPTKWPWGFALVSIGYAMACAALWSSVPEVVKARSLGLAFGVIHAVMDVMIMVTEVVIGRLLDTGHTYESAVWPMLVGFTTAGFLATLALMHVLMTQVKLNAVIAAMTDNEDWDE